MSGPAPVASSARDHAVDLLAVEQIAAIPTISDVVCRTTGMGVAAVARVTEGRWIACGVRDDEAEGLTAAPRGAGRRVLVVEDNLEVGRFATQTLEDLGYVTTWATDAADALARLSANADAFDVVFSDVVMPGMNGVALGQEIRRLYPRLPVLLASGYSHVLAEEGRHGFELLHKPYSVEQLSHLLRQVTQRRPRTRS